MTGISAVRLDGGRRAARGPWRFRCTSLPSRSRPALEVPGNTSKTKGAPRKYQDGPASWPRSRFREGQDSLDCCMAGDADYRRLVRGATANKLQFSALLWPSCAKSGILYLHGGQREQGIPEPHEPGHTRERLKEVRATHARTKKSGPQTPPCPNYPRWRCGVYPNRRRAEAAARAGVEAGRVPKVERGGPKDEAS